MHIDIYIYIYMLYLFVILKYCYIMRAIILNLRYLLFIILFILIDCQRINYNDYVMIQRFKYDSHTIKTKYFYNEVLLEVN